MIVLDASAAVELVLATGSGAAVARRLRGEALHAPAHFDVEAIGAIRRAVIRRLLSDHEGLVSVADFQSLPVRRWPTKALAQRAYQLRHTHTVADGMYVALAEGLEAPLVTCDERLAQSHGHDADIELLA
ncbi:type II toxin-antitoxin system VapC family toxin [Mycobacterium lacus]|uniref:Ribonuclease VapC n=1 Tax=Mycobacterium lacus TaxID=169765 RepID=A0A1X1Y752_9MYCO|nr:type II toxin-antitoxin system VapC family toxin [Mycobacterium lacus]MCV7124346.1 PIN domain-containing protein [Mycobacterium lacus]ORW06831.1 ribonuclease [Mycobacterium lacus]BBX96340.1 ribonuclease VapC [Mycobacterium lacus]